MKSNFRLLASYLLVGLLPLAVAAAFGALAVQSTFAEQAAARLRASAGWRQRQLETWVDGLSGALFGLSVQFPNLPEQLASGSDAALAASVRRPFMLAQRPDGFTEIMLITASNRLIYSSNGERRAAPQYVCPLKIVCASEFLRERDQTQLIVQYPLLDANGMQAGALLGLAETGTLDSILGSRADLAPGVVAYLVNPAGDLRWLPGQPITVPRGVNLPLDQSVQVSGGVRFAGLGGAAVGVFVFVPRLFAHLVIEQPAAAFDTPPLTWLLVVGSITALTAAAALLLSRYMRGQIAKPLLAAERRLNEANRALEGATAAEQRQSRAIADMGHELRTPINAVLNFSGFLSDGLFGELNTDQGEMVRQIHGSSQHLLELINDLIDIAQVQAGQMRLFVREYDPVPVFEQAIATLHSLVLERPITVQTDLPRAWPTLHGDKRRVLQILLNLISNAAKFTERGTITVRVHTYPRRLLVRVEDSGLGVDPAAAAHLFEPFAGGYNLPGQEKGGTGLGLALSKIFAQMHGGDLSYQPGEAGGAVFILTLPLDAVGASIADTQPEASGAL